MGNTHSTSRIDREETKRPSIGRRKLSKPRVGNPSSRGDISIPCLPPAPVIIGGRVLLPANGTVQEASCAVPRQLVVSEAYSIPGPEDGMVPLNCGSSRSRHASISHQQLPPGSHSRKPSLTESYRESSLLPTRYNSSRNSTLASYNVNTKSETNGLDQSHPPPSVMRRRSQIVAAPPATRTRRHPTLIIEGGIPAPPLIALDLAEADSAQTPSGYSVLGGFKRGSLRIMNTTASPAPSPQDLIPKRRNTSPAHPKTPSCSVLMVAPTPQITLDPQGNEGYFGFHGILEPPNTASADCTITPSGQETDTPLSFRTAPEGIFCFNDDYKITSSPALAKSSNSELISPNLSRTAGDPTDMPIVRNTSSSSNLRSKFSGTAGWRPYKKPGPRPSVKSSTDSGYCSAGSIRSLNSYYRKASDGDLQHGCEATNTEPARFDPPINSSQFEPPLVTSNATSRPLMGVVQDEVFPKFTDKYRLDAAKEGPIIAEHILSPRTRKLSLSSSTHIFR